MLLDVVVKKARVCGLFCIASDDIRRYFAGISRLSLPDRWLELKTEFLNKAAIDGGRSHRTGPGFYTERRKYSFFELTRCNIVFVSRTGWTEIA